jgi:hypothetical protein
MTLSLRYGKAAAALQLANGFVLDVTLADSYSYACCTPFGVNLPWNGHNRLEG